MLHIKKIAAKGLIHRLLQKQKRQLKPKLKTGLYKETLEKLED